MDTNFQVEIKNGIMYDRHTVYFRCFCSEKILRNAIESYIKRSITNIKKKNINKNYHLNFIELNNTNVGYGHIYFNESAFYYMLTKRKPSGEKFGKIIDNQNYVNYEERMKITAERYKYYKENKNDTESKIKWSWMCEYDYPDEDEELNNNTKTLFIESDFENLGNYIVDEYSYNSIKSYIKFKQQKYSSDENNDYSSEIDNVQIGDTLSIKTNTITFKYNDYIDTLLIFNYPNHIKNDEILSFYQVFFETDIKNYVKKITNKMNSIEVQFKIKEYAQLLNAICRNMKVDHNGSQFVLKNKPINK